MNEKSLNPDSLAAAERWYARLKAPDCSAAERIEFRRWREEPEHAAAYARTERLWDSLGRLAGRPELDQLSKRILADTATRPWRRFATAASITAASLVVLGGGIVLHNRNSQTPAVVYTTKPGERSIIKLADGSQLILNYATEVDVRLENHTRRLTLRQGDALFVVSRDEQRPFKVTAGDGEVTALGTRFEVRSDTQHVAVTLLEGRVSVDRADGRTRVQLTPGDQVRFTVAAAETTRRRVDPEVVSSWTTGRLRFRSTPLAEALDEVNRYTATPIRIADPTLAAIPISGTFEIGDGVSVVSAITALLPIRSEDRDGEILLRPRD